MTESPEKMAVLDVFRRSNTAMNLPEVSSQLNGMVPERTLRRWLANWVEEGVLVRTGKKRGTRYQWSGQDALSQSAQPIFLQKIPEHRRTAVLEQVRDLWTHTSTALEGNTLSLGDTHAVLGLGLTVSGKPLREHQEIVGHAKAIELVYQSLFKPLDKQLLFDLHKAVQTDVVQDIYKPIGAWKQDVNGTYSVTSDGQQVFIEYADPRHVDVLMGELISEVNRHDPALITLETAAAVYAKVHMGIVHIHPFWDGNGRMARLVANMPLLKAGQVPLVIDQTMRREYIECLAEYQVKVGRLSNKSGVWPDETLLKEFTAFCMKAYSSTRELLEEAMQESVTESERH